jgi:hypothetical protein
MGRNTGRAQAVCGFGAEAFQSHQKVHQSLAIRAAALAETVSYP